MSDRGHASADCRALPAESLSCLLHRVHRAQQALVAAHLDELGLHAGQEYALEQLWRHGPKTQAQLAGLVGVDTSTMCRTLQRLDRAGFVKRSPSEADRRTTVVEPTPAGDALRDGLGEARSRTNEYLSRALTPAELAELLRLLGKVVADLEAT